MRWKIQSTSQPSLPVESVVLGARKKNLAFARAVLSQTGIARNGRSQTAARSINAQKSIEYSFVDCAQNFRVSGYPRRSHGIQILCRT